MGKTTRKTPGDFQRLADSRGFEWLGPMALTNAKTNWRCPEGHEWEARYEALRRGQGCPHCAGNAQKTPYDYHALAVKQGFIWLGPLVKSIHASTGWRCSQGHEWNCEYNSINSANTGCPVCAGNLPKTANDYRALATSRGFEWLGPMSQSVHIATSWRCSSGHTWQAAYSNLSDGGTSCPYCANHVKKTPDDYHALAAERGIDWIGVVAPNTNAMTRWRCAEGHEWDMRYGRIKRGDRCPQCDTGASFKRVNRALVSKPQMKLHKMLGGEINYPVRRYRIDIALMEQPTLAIEYDCWYWHDLKRDAVRDKYLVEHGWRILRVKSGSLLPTLDQLNAALDRLRAGETYVELVLTDWHEPAA